MQRDITIVTAFFDIGRGDWRVEDGHPDYLQRTSEQYLTYFSHLAKLDNPMIIFTEVRFEKAIRQYRGDRPTVVITLDLPNVFTKYLQQIANIQLSATFRAKVNPRQLKNPEYWSPKYVLVTNLKAHFINHAIRQSLIKTPLIAWVDFGYCQTPDVLGKLRHWRYDFAPNKLHVFSVNKLWKVTKREHVDHAIFNNKAYIIGGILVGDKTSWQQFAHIIRRCQHSLLRQNMVDDDQGVFLLAKISKPSLFQNHHLGKEQWRVVLQRYHEQAQLTWGQKLKKRLGLL